MKKKMISISLIAFLGLACSLFFSHNAEADCCMTSCQPSTGGVCLDGGTPYAGDCSQAGCGGGNLSPTTTPAAGPTTTSAQTTGVAPSPTTTTSPTTGTAQSPTTATAGAGAAGAASGSTTFTNPIAFNTVSALLTSVLNNLMGVIATLAVLFIVIGGIMYVMSGGSEAMITRAKKTWTGAAIGLAIALGAPAFINTIKQVLGGSAQSGQSLTTSTITLQQIATNTLNLLLSIFGILAIIALVVGGGTYLTAYGDEKRIDTGKRIITYAIIGIVVALAALVIVQQVSMLMGGQTSTSSISPYSTNSSGLGIPNTTSNTSAVPASNGVNSASAPNSSAATDSGFMMPGLTPNSSCPPGAQC
ncbi:MAG: pilin [Candidatus Pacebacteria bacterium]|nr:pilin [Candidatus Paceibacterota bacterium]MDR3583693.1 pilin [Candidatus Paceibacterota bacterium]